MAEFRIPMTYEEGQFLAILNTMNEEGTRDGLIKLVKEYKPMNDQVADEEDNETIKAMTIDAYNGALRCLLEMSDDEFSKLELNVDYAALGFPDSIDDLLQ